MTRTSGSVLAALYLATAAAGADLAPPPREKPAAPAEAPPKDAMPPPSPDSPRIGQRANLRNGQKAG